MQRLRTQQIFILKPRCIVGYVSLPASMETTVDTGVAMERTPGRGRWGQAVQKTGFALWPRFGETSGRGSAEFTHLQ